MQEPNSTEWQAPPSSPDNIKREEPEMSEVATLGNIFFEPGRTFEDLRRKPRFILATVVVVLLMTAYSFALYYKVGDAGVRQFIVEQIEKNPQAGSMNAEQKANAVDLQMTISTVGRYAFPLVIAIIMVLGGALYWAAGKAFGGTGNFLHGWAVFVYSSLPPTVVSMIANFIVLAFKSVDDIDLATSQRGVIHANPAILLDGKSMPVLATLVGTLDLFMIWGWVLAAIGLRITNKISSASAWSIVLIFALIGIFFRVIGAYFSGNPT
ncbi:MAG TPA: Yip1 family protein [Pyrinomonadaceae bacterium]